MVDIKLGRGETYRSNGLQVLVKEIILLRLPIDPETGIGSDELELILLLKGSSELECRLNMTSPAKKPSVDFEGHTITLNGYDGRAVELGID
jgi:hypothetical protein